MLKFPLLNWILCLDFGFIWIWIPPCFGSTLSRWSQLHLQSLAPTKPHWARMVGYGPSSLCIIHKESLFYQETFA
jgi:hypothetical protein